MLLRSLRQEYRTGKALQKEALFEQRHFKTEGEMESRKNFTNGITGTLKSKKHLEKGDNLKHLNK